MATYYIIYFIIILGVSFVLLRHFLPRKNSASMQLFMDANKAENRGDYLQAVNTYENALKEANKSKFHGHLKMIIIKKLKVLQTVTTYEDNLAFVRKGNSWVK
jgi:uncharacterized membrane protein